MKTWQHIHVVLECALAHCLCPALTSWIIPSKSQKFRASISPFDHLRSPLEINKWGRNGKRRTWYKERLAVFSLDKGCAMPQEALGLAWSLKSSAKLEVRGKILFQADQSLNTGCLRIGLYFG